MYNYVVIAVALLTLGAHACAARATVLYLLCLCLCIILSSGGITQFYAKKSYTQLFYQFFLVFDLWIFEQTLRS